MTLNDLESLSKIFNDTKRRAVSLRQLSFLFLLVCVDYSQSVLYLIRSFNSIDRHVNSPVIDVLEPEPIGVADA